MESLLSHCTTWGYELKQKSKPTIKMYCYMYTIVYAQQYQRELKLL